MFYEDYGLLALSGLASTAYNLLKSKDKLGPKSIMSETVLSLICSIIIMPAVMEESEMSMNRSCAICALLTMFIHEIIIIVRNKFKKKIKEL
jgi:hypothetical protein